MVQEIEKITGVAIIVNGILYHMSAPNRHHHVIHFVYERNGIQQVTTDQQGFVTSHDRYVNREKALEIAKAANQLLPDKLVYHRELFSENLW